MKMTTTEAKIKIMYELFVLGLKEGIQANDQELIDLQMPAPKNDSETIIYREPHKFNSLPTPITYSTRRPDDLYLRYEPFYIKFVIKETMFDENMISYYTESSVRDVLNSLSDRCKLFYVGELVELSYKPLIGKYIEVVMKVNIISPRS